MKTRGPDFIQLPLEVYAEFAANLSPKAMDLLLRRRREICAAVYIQYRVRIWLRKRLELAVFASYCFNRWRCRLARRKIVSSCKTRRDQLLLLFKKWQRAIHRIAVATISAQWIKYLAVRRLKIDQIFSAIRKFFSQRALISSPMKNTNTFSDIKSHQVFETNLLLPRRKKDLSSVKSVRATSLLTDREIRAGRRILFALRAWIRKRNVYKLKLSLLVLLVTKIQALFRGARVRQELKKSHELERMKRELALIAELKEREEIDRLNRLKLRKQMMIEAAKSNNLEIPSALSHMLNSDSDTKGAGIDVKYDPERQEISLIKSKIFAFLSQHSLLWLKANALVMSVVPHTVAASRLKDEAACHGEQALIELEPVDVLLPKDVHGLLAQGVVVDSTSPIAGAKVDASDNGGWVVDELTDSEQYDLQYEMVKKAAIKIQRFYRRRLTHRKFLAYINEKDLNTVREEQEAVDQANEEALERGEDPPPPPPSDAVNTDACAVM